MRNTTLECYNNNNSKNSAGDTDEGWKKWHKKKSKIRVLIRREEYTRFFFYLWCTRRDVNHKSIRASERYFSVPVLLKYYHGLLKRWRRQTYKANDDELSFTLVLFIFFFFCFNTFSFSKNGLIFFSSGTLKEAGFALVRSNRAVLK